MNNGKGFLIGLSSGCMELSWLYAWAIFIMTSVFHRPFPLPEAVCTFGLAAALTSFSFGRGWRIIQILGLQVLGFILVSLRIVYVFNDWSYSFINPNWVIECFHISRTPLEWFMLILILFWTLLFWIGGLTLARRSTAYLTTCARFDLGVSFLFLLLLTKFLLQVKGGIQIQDPLSELLLFPFFLFSLLAIGLARNKSQVQREFLSGYGGIGVMLSFTVTVLLLGTGVTLLSLPYLTLAAKAGYGILKSTAEPLVPILVTVIRFLYFRNKFRTDDSSASSKESKLDAVPSVETGWWTDIFGEYVRFGFLCVVGLVLLVLSGVIVFYLLRWLFSRTPTSSEKQGQGNLLSFLVTRLREFLHLFWGLVVHRGKRKRGPRQFYTALLKWGRHSGLPHFSNETPIEYRRRLERRFPVVKEEIGSIIEVFNQEVYGETVVNEQQLFTAWKAWINLRSPSHWASRLKSWFLQPSNDRIN